MDTMDPDPDPDTGSGYPDSRVLCDSRNPKQLFFDLDPTV
jgi:hypothetical protein